MTEQEADICQPYFHAVECFAKLYGAPLPKAMLEIGNPNQGWHVRLNATRDSTDEILAFEMVITWGGFIAGSMRPFGGIIANGELANESTFIEWLQSYDG